MLTCNTLAAFFKQGTIMSVETANKAYIASQSQPAPSPQRKIVIAVDGPSASGKGTLAKMLADRLGYAYLDTGALYRAVALATLELGGDPTKFADVEPALAIVARNLTPELLANPALRSHEVSEASSKVAAIPDVRVHLLDYQRAFAKNPPGNVGGAVLDGRDIGTVVCPQADLKFFVTASPEERAKRRFAELKTDRPDLTLEKVLQDIQQRDQRDSSRKIAPTLAADDACTLDTTRMNAQETLEEAIAILRAKFIAESDIAPAGF
jgi:cytidylate kinase